MNQKHKSRATIGFILFILLWSLSFYHIYLYFYSILNMNLHFLVYLLIIQTLGYFMKLSQHIINTLRWFRFQDYFDEFNFFAEQAGDPTNTMFICHPHGILPFGLSIAVLENQEIFHHATLLATRIVIYAPLMGLLFRGRNYDSVNSSNLIRYMKQQKNIAILPGGFEEATLNSNEENILYLRNRKGFIKYALKYNYKIQPVFTFGENKTYYTWHRFKKIGLILNKLKLPGIIFWSKYLIIPNQNVRLTSIVGKQIILPQIDDPQNEDIDKYHKLYIQEVEQLYENYKVQYGYEDQLKIQ